MQVISNISSPMLSPPRQDGSTIRTILGNYGLEQDNSIQVIILFILISNWIINMDTLFNCKTAIDYVGLFYTLYLPCLILFMIIFAAVVRCLHVHPLHQRLLTNRVIRGEIFIYNFLIFNFTGLATPLFLCITLPMVPQECGSTVTIVSRGFLIIVGILAIPVFLVFNGYIQYYTRRRAIRVFAQDDEQV
jgi:hypothetical protein